MENFQPAFPTEETPDFITARHSIKPKKEDKPSVEYPGISENGVALARNEAHTWYTTLEEAPEKAVLLMSPTTNLVRTKSTMRVVADELEHLVAEGQVSGVTVIRESDFADTKLTYDQMIEHIQAKVDANPDHKIVICVPLTIKEFGDRWANSDGSLTPYTEKLLTENNMDPEASLRSWITNQGHLGDLEGPNPDQVAVEHLQGIQRMYRFAKGYVPNRPLVIGAIGHSWGLDALAVYLANNNHVDIEGYEKIGGSGIKEMEPIMIRKESDGTKLWYGDRVEMVLDHDQESE